MKLLAPSATKDLKSLEVTRELLRSQEMQKVADKTRKELANAEADFNQTLAKNRNIWAKEEEEHSNRIREMDSEIKVLEREKQIALEPIEIFRKQATDELLKATALKEKLEIKEKEIETLDEKLQDKLDKVGQEEEDNLKESQRLELQKQGIESQKQAVVAGAKRLSSQIVDFTETKKQAEKNIDERKTAITLIEVSLSSKETNLKNKESELTKLMLDIKQATQTLDAKRKESLVPVEILKIEAQQLKDEAGIVLASAEWEHRLAVSLNAKAQTDYDIKLDSLNEREKTVKIKEEETVIISQKTQTESRFIYDERKKLDKLIEDFKSQAKQLQLDKDSFLKEKVDVYNIANERIIEADRKEANALSILDKASKIESACKLKEAKLDSQRVAQLAVNNDLENKQSKLTVWENQILEIKKTTELAVEELKKESEAFAVWRSGAEKTVENKAMENSKKHRLLANKEDRLRRQEKFLADWNVRLQDERGTLERAFKRLNIPIENKQ